MNAVYEDRMPVNEEAWVVCLFLWEMTSDADA